MKIKKIIAICLGIILCICLCSCQDNSSSETNNSSNSSTTVPSKDEMGSISHGVIDPDPIDCDFTFSFNGEPIRLTYMLENGASANCWGLCIFVNGMQQPFSIDKGEEIYLYKSQFKENERKDLNLEFTPISGNKGETITIYFVVMVDPDYILSENQQNKRYGNYHSITQMPWLIHMNEDSPENTNNILSDFGMSKELTDTYKQNYLVEGENGETTCLLDSNTYIELFSDSLTETSFDITKKDKQIVLQLNLAGINKTVTNKLKYRISLYVDHKIVNCFNNQPYIDISVEPNKVSYTSINLNYEEMSQRHHIYLIAVPIYQTQIGNGILPIIKTETKSINIQEG